MAAQWGWRNPRTGAIRDVVIRQVFQSLERYLIEKDEATTGDVEAVAGDVTVLQADLSAVEADLGQLPILESSELAGVPQVTVRWTPWGVAAGVPYWDGAGVVGAEQAHLMLMDDGTPALVLLEGI